MIGDSLDATLSKEVEAVYGDTDILIFQKDRRTGFSFDMDSNLTSSFGQQLTTQGVADKWLHGIDTTVTLSKADGLALPSAGWYAYEGWSGVSINQVAADELSLGKGDPLEVSWFSLTEDGELLRESRNVTITSVISMDGKGSMAGTKSPALFSDLAFAQELQSKNSKVNMLRVSLVDEGDATEQFLLSKILDDLIDAEDSGFEITTEGDSMSISNGDGLGRLDGISCLLGLKTSLLLSGKGPRWKSYKYLLFRFSKVRKLCPCPTIESKRYSSMMRSLVRVWRSSIIPKARRWFKPRVASSRWRLGQRRNPPRRFTIGCTQ